MAPKPVTVGMSIKMTRIVGVAAGVLLALGATACNDDGKGSPESKAGNESSASQNDDGKSSDGPSQDGSKGDGKDDKGTKGSTMTLSGKISKGTESGCRLLKQDGETYNLVGGDKNIMTVGTEVEVSGSVQDGMMTTCQQGKPFKVSDAKIKGK